MKLRYTRKAAQELRDILADISEDSPLGARRVRSRIKSATSLVTGFPLSGRQTRNPRLRSIIATPYPYLIFYEIRDSTIIIVAVRHGARDPHSMPDADQTS